MTEPALKFPQRDAENWPAQGAWTYEDYCRLPDDGNRYEVIRGNLYVTAAPIPEHQFTILKLSRYLDEFVSAAGLGMVLTAPLDVMLPAGIGSPVQPDVVFFRKGNEPRRGMRYCEEAPDLLVEVLSPGTRRRDRTVKLKAYRDAGVPEYWLVDPESRTVEVHVLESGKYVERSRGGVGDAIGSSVLPGFQVNVASLFMP